MKRVGWLCALCLAALLARADAAETLKRTLDGKKIEENKPDPNQKGIVVEDVSPHAPPIPPPPHQPAPYAATHEVGRELAEKQEAYAFSIEPGLVRKVEVTWHDDLGGRSKAKGSVFVDRMTESDALQPSSPDEPGSLRADIKSDLHVSTFLPKRPMRCRGVLILRVDKDDAFVRCFKVYYDGGAHDRSPPSSPGPRRPLSLRPVKYTVTRELDHEKHYHSFSIQRGAVSKVDLYWKDDLGKTHDAKGRVYLNGFARENLLEPHNPDPNYLTPTADIEKNAHVTTFECRRPTESDGRLLIQILEDDAKIYTITVHYLSAAEPPAPPRPIKPPKQPAGESRPLRPQPNVKQGEKVQRPPTPTLRERLKGNL